MGQFFLLTIIWFVSGTFGLVAVGWITTWQNIVERTKSILLMNMTAQHLIFFLIFLKISSVTEIIMKTEIFQVLRLEENMYNIPVLKMKENIFEIFKTFSQRQGNSCTVLNFLTISSSEKLH